jgi:hypothetical protein
LKILCRTGPPKAGFFHKVSATEDLGDCVVAGAVHVEPVSTPKFPANREKNREFCKFGPACVSDDRIRPMISGLLSRIPYTTEQGIVSTEQGILVLEQGISPAKPKQSLD